MPKKENINANIHLQNANKWSMIALVFALNANGWGGAKMERIVLHSDLNCFYASVEMRDHPELRGRRVAVCGSTEDRHGIVLTASYPAKRCGVKTGMANWQALQVCPDLICVPPHYEKYLACSRSVRAVYARYADDIEPYGMDENWLAIPRGGGVETTGREVAEEIRRAVREETGLTVSVGVSFSKVFAKLGSDMKKPDAVTVISEENYRRLVWPLPVSELLYAGPATTRKLRGLSILTIGQLARADPALLRQLLGINGVKLWHYANGTDGTQVQPAGWEVPVQSVGHGVTCVQDLQREDEVWLVLYALSQDVGHRLRAHGFLGRGVQVAVRRSDLSFVQWQQPLGYPTRSPLELSLAGFELFRRRYDWRQPVRALTIRAVNLLSDEAPLQLDLFSDAARHEKRRRLDDAVDEVRRRFGPGAVRPASLMADAKMAQDRCELVPMPGLMFGG